MKERWLVRILVDRDPLTEDLPRMWDWDQLLEGGDVTVLMCQHVGYNAEDGEEQRARKDDVVTCCICDNVMGMVDLDDGHTTHNHNRPERKALPCHEECVPKERNDYR